MVRILHCLLDHTSSNQVGMLGFFFIEYGGNLKKEFTFVTTLKYSTMKRILLIAAMLFASALYASAEYSRYYVTETVTGRDGMYCIRIDWDEKLYELEGDGNEGEIRNLKEDGNKRAFDVYFDEGYGTKKKVLSVVFTTEDKDTFTITTITPSGEKSVYKCSSKDPHGYGDSGSSSLRGKVGEKANAIKDAIGKGISKGIDSMKQKKEAKKEAKENGNK